VIEEIRVLTKRWAQDDAHTLAGYERTGGYAAARKALGAAPGELIQLVKDSGLRGRGGAGFPTGQKWSFIPQDTGKPIYLVVNADEGEPGTFKDRELMERDPHQLIDGMICSGLAIGSEHGYLYLRGEFAFAGRRLAAAIHEAYGAGYLGADVFGSGKRFDITLHRGAGAYICGEETALLDSLEGRRGQPRLRPPFPAVSGLYQSPTTVNNVETICSFPHIVENGAEWFTQWGTEQSPGPKIVCMSGEVKRPGNYEVPMGTPVRAIIDDLGGGMLDGRELRYFSPGGSSTPYLPADKVDVGMDFEAIAEAGSLLGTAALMVFSDQTCVVDATWRFTEFYEHESCGKCTPCREGTYWLSQVLARIETGSGREEDLQVLLDVCGNMFGRSFCALADGATSPITSSIELFRDDYERHIAQGRCPMGTTPAKRRPVTRMTDVRPPVSAMGRVALPLAGRR